MPGQADHCGNHLFRHCVNCWLKIMQKHSLEAVFFFGLHGAQMPQKKMGCIKPIGKI